MALDKWFPNVLDIEGKLDPNEVFQSDRLQWESIYALKSTQDGMLEAVGDLVLANEASRGGSDNEDGFGPFQVLNPQRNRLPYLNASLLLDALNAPEYDPATQALTIVGAITGRSTLSIAGASTLTGNTTVGGTLIVTGAVTASSTLGVTGATTLSSTLAVTSTSLLSGTTTTFGRIKTLTRKTTTYQILVTDSVIFGNPDGSAWTATLPAGVSGQTLKVINSGSSGNILTVAPNGSEHLLGVNSNFALFDAETLDLTYDSTDGWY